MAEKERHVHGGRYDPPSAPLVRMRSSWPLRLTLASPLLITGVVLGLLAAAIR